jgi:hypothetical protein
MQVLVATTDTQGRLDTDYCWTLDGELVRLPGIECANPGCGCSRGWAGLASSRATTTCRVADLALDRHEVLAAFTDALDREGWLAGLDDRSWVGDWVDEHLALAAAYPVGTILGKQGDHTLVRRLPERTAG